MSDPALDLPFQKRLASRKFISFLLLELIFAFAYFFKGLDATVWGYAAVGIYGIYAGANVWQSGISPTTEVSKW